MKRFLFLFMAVMISNSVAANKTLSSNKPLYFSHTTSGGTTAVSETGSVIPHNRIEVTRNPLNTESILFGLFGVAGLLTSVYEGSFSGSVFSALTVVSAAMEFKKHSVRIKKYNDKTLVGSVSIMGEPAVLENVVAREQAEVDAREEESNKMKKSKHLNSDGALAIPAAVVAEQANELVQ